MWEYRGSGDHGRVVFEASRVTDDEVSVCSADDLYLSSLLVASFHASASTPSIESDCVRAFVYALNVRIV